LTSSEGNERRGGNRGRRNPRFTSAKNQGGEKNGISTEALRGVREDDKKKSEASDDQGSKKDVLGKNVVRIDGKKCELQKKYA